MRQEDYDRLDTVHDPYGYTGISGRKSLVTNDVFGERGV
jgi:hypothetical protein